MTATACSTSSWSIRPPGAQAPARRRPAVCSATRAACASPTSPPRPASCKPAGARPPCGADYDNDGYTDLFVSYWGENKLFHNEGAGVFEDVSKKAGFSPDGRRWNTGCAFLDYDHDGLLDLAVASYVGFDPEKTPKRGENELCRYHGEPVLCGPRGLPGGTNRLFHNEGNGRFRDVSAPSGFSGVAGCYGLGALAEDFDGDGLTDVYIACDSTPSILFRNRGDGTFRDIGLEAGVALNENGREQGGMGIAAGDFDGDGRIDLVKTNFADDLPSLYRNDGEGFFSDTAYRGGLGVHTDRVGWGVGFLDFDLDGFQDLLIVNGHVYPEADAFRQSALLYWNLGNGAFLDVSANAGPAIGEPRVSRGAAFGDLDNDGRIEVVINDLDGAPTLLRQTNEPSGHWLTLRLEGVESNRDGIGARARIAAGDAVRTAAVRSGGSYLSDNDRRLHFGLGAAETAEEVRISWPSGRHESFGPLAADRIHTLREGAGRAEGAIDH